MPAKQNIYGLVTATSVWTPLQVDAAGRLVVDNRHDDITQEAKTAVGVIKSGLTYLYWITIVPSAASSTVILTDAVAGGASIKWGYKKAAVDSDHIQFVPALKFSTGMYLETLTNVTAIIVAYNIV